MSWLDTLWHVRGEIALAPDTDEEGLIARVADILVQDGARIDAEENLLVRFSATMTWLLDRTESDTLPTIHSGKVRLQGIRGRRTMCYDFNSFPPLIVSLALGIGLALMITMKFDPATTLPAAAILFAGMYGIPNLIARARVRAFLKRAIAN